jgi:hypothetical protein
LGIYEMIAPESQFFAAVAAHCAPEWAGAAK